MEFKKILGVAVLTASVAACSYSIYRYDKKDQCYIGLAFLAIPAASFGAELYRCRK